MPRLSAPSRRDCPPGSSPAAQSRRGCFPSLHRRISAVPAAARLPLCPISMRHRHPLEFRKGRSTAKRHIRTITCSGSRVVRGRLPRGRLTRDDASYRESERKVGDGLSASRSAHGRWLADGPGRAMTGRWFGCAALLSDANVAVAEGGRADAVGPSRQAKTHGPGVCSSARSRARLRAGITGLRMATPPEASSTASDALRNPPPTNTAFRTGTPSAHVRSARSGARHGQKAGRSQRR